MKTKDEWTRAQAKRRDNENIVFACPECGKLFPYRKNCLNHMRECCGILRKPVRIEAVAELGERTE